MLLFGVGNGGAQLSRYAAADLYPPERRGFALGSLVWAGTVGAVVGPNLLSPAAAAAGAFDIPRFAGVFLLALLAAAGAGVAVAVMPRNPSRSALQTEGGFAPPFRELRTSPNVKVALTAMLTSQLVMVAVMTMTPVHIDHEGHGLDTVGLVLSVHTLGMFALSPISGRLTDRFGSRAIIMAGLGTLAAAAVLAIAAPTADGAVLPLALFLLGYGWNLNLVGGSRLLSGDLPAAAQARVQGIVEALVWGASAFASLISGVIFTIGGYSVLAVAAGTLIAIPAVVLARERRLALS
jgi:MFS family permease